MNPDQVTPDAIRAQAGFEPSTNGRLQLVLDQPSPRQVFEDVQRSPFPDMRRNFEVARMFVGAVMADTDIETRAWDYQQQQLQPLRDVERERFLMQQAAQDAALKAWESRQRPGFREAITAMFLLENTLVSPMLRVNIPRMPAMPGYDPLAQDMEGYWPIADQIVKSVHPAQTEIIKANYDEELRQRDILQRAGTPLNLITGVAAGITDPIYLGLMLTGTPAAVGRMGTTARFAYGSGLATTAAAIGEVVLHSQQDTRTLEESALNVLGSLLLDGAIGGTYVALRARSTPDYKAAEKAAREYLRSGGRVDVTDDFARESVGAARVPVEDVSIRRFDPKHNPVRWALGSFAEFMSRVATPIGRGLSASSNKVRTVTANLAETNIQLTGEIGQVAAETLIKVDYRRAQATKLEIYELERRAQQEFGIAPDEFATQLDHAQRHGDLSDNPLITQAAQRLRAFTQDLWERAAEQRIPGTFREVTDPVTGAKTVQPVEVSTAISYQSRVYNMNAIDADHDGFFRAVRDGLVDARNTHNLEIDTRISDFRAQQGPGVARARQHITEQQQLKEAKQALIRNADTAIKANREHIGRLKERNKADPEIASLQARIKDIEARRKALRAEVRKIDADIKASRTTISNFRARIKAMEGEKLAPYMDYELDAAANSFYQGVANLKEGDVHFTAGANILKHRTPIKDSYLWPYLEKNWAKRLDQHVKTLSPRVRLAEKFGNADGDFEMRSTLESIRGDYATRIQDLKAEGKIKEAQKLNREMNQQLRNLEFMRDSLLSRVFADDRTSVTQSMGRSLLNFNVSRMLNGMMLSSIPEIAKITAKYGMAKFNRALLKSMKHWRIKDLPQDEAMAIASSLYRAQSTRAAQMADLYDITPTTWLEDKTRVLAQMTNYWSGQQGFDSLFKSVAGALSSNNFVHLVRNGDVAALRKLGFDENQIRVIQREIPKHAREAGGLWEPHIEMWDLTLIDQPGFRPRSVKDTFDALIVKDADTLIVQPGVGDRPKLMTSMTGRVLFQFKSFIMGATNRTLVPLAQGSNVEMFRNLAYMNALSIAGYVAYETGTGREIDWSDADALINEMMNRGGYIGYATELMQLYRRLAGKGEASRWRGRDDVGSLLGPSYGTATDLFRAVGVRRDAETGEFLTDVDSRVRAMRKLMPFHNHFMIRRMLDKAEGRLAESLGGDGRFAEPPQ